MAQQPIPKTLAIAAAIAVAAAGSGLAWAPVHAQQAKPLEQVPQAATKGPTQAQILAEQQRLKGSFDEAAIKAAAQAQAAGAQAMPGRPAAPGLQGMPGLLPRVGPSITPEEIKAAAGDPAELSRAYQRGLKNPSRDEAPPVMVFASLSMPRESLLRLARSAATARVPIYFRGVAHGIADGGMKRSVQALEPYVQAGAQVLLHPDMFELYNVTLVPAVVVTTAPRVGCAEESCEANFAKVIGDATLGYSLRQLTDRKDAIGAEARRTLALLKKD